MVNYRTSFYRVEQIKKDISLRTRKLLERTVLIMEKIIAQVAIFALPTASLVL